MGNQAPDRNVRRRGVRVERGGFGGFFAPHPADNLGYLDPADRPNQIIALPYYVSEHNLVSAHRSTAFVQDTWTRESARGDLRVHVGARVHRWSVLTHPEASTRNTHVVGGPRANVSFVPSSMAQTVLRVSGGYYYQPRFTVRCAASMGASATTWRPSVPSTRWRGSTTSSRPKAVPSSLWGSSFGKTSTTSSLTRLRTSGNATTRPTTPQATPPAWT